MRPAQGALVYIHWPGLHKYQSIFIEHMPEPGVRLVLALFYKHPSLTTQTLANNVLALSFHDLISLNPVVKKLKTKTLMVLIYVTL